MSIKRKSALVIVDMQNDFLPGGALAIPQGDAILPKVNAYLELFERRGLPIIATRDWHPPETTHFQVKGGVWPIHCVQGTPGAEFHPDLALPDKTIGRVQGDGADEDAYSAFQARDAQGRPLPTCCGPGRAAPVHRRAGAGLLREVHRPGREPPGLGARCSWTPPAR